MGNLKINEVFNFQSLLIQTLNGLLKNVEKDVRKLKHKKEQKIEKIVQIFNILGAKKRPVVLKSLQITYDSYYMLKNKS